MLAMSPSAEIASSPVHFGGEFELTLDKRINSPAPRVLQAREHAFFEGDPTENVYRVEKGTICLYMTLPDGRRQIIDFAYQGDLIGLGVAGEHMVSAQAITLSKLRCLPAKALYEVARHDPQVGLQLYRALSDQLAGARDLLLTVGRRSATQRLATLLIALSRRNERIGADPDRIALPMSRADIADFLSLTIETVSRTFTKLRQGGVISLAQASLVIIRDRAALEELCGEDS